MRTTINLPDTLVSDAKKLAADQGTTLTEVIADALRERLDSQRTRAHGKAARVSLTTSGSGGVQPGVDLDDTSTLLDIMDGLG